jgi:HlyD family secretion protein
MRGSTIVLLIIGLLILIGATFFITNPEAGRQVLADLGLIAPPEDTYTASGVIEASIVALGSEVGGRVEELTVAEGDRVQQGDIVARLSTELLNAQRAVLQARYDAALTQLGILNRGPRDEDQAVAEAVVALTEAILGGAEQALVDTQNLSESVPTRDELIVVAQAQVSQAQAGVDGAQAALSALREGASESMLESAQAAVYAALADLDEIDRQIGNQAIRSPLDGMVMEQLALVGELALPGWPVALVADLSEVELKVFIPEADLNWVYLGQLVSVRVDAYPDRLFDGEVTAIADRAEFTPRNVQTPNERVILVFAVTIRLSNPDETLKPGLPADAIFEVLQ